MRGVYEKEKGSKDFFIRYTDADGRRHREHIGRESAAVEALVNRRREVREGRFIAPHNEPRISFAELAEKMLADKALRVRSSTLGGNRRVLRRLLPMLGNLSARQISPAKISEVLQALKYTAGRPRISKRAPGGDTQLVKGEISGPSLQQYRIFMGSIFSYGVLHGFLRENPVSKTKGFAKHKGIVRYLTADEEKALRSVILEENPEFIWDLDLALHTGLRKGEHRLLTKDKIDLERGIITVPEGGKTGRRFVPINSACLRAIEELAVLSEGEDQLSPFNWRSKGEWLQKWLKKAGIIKFRWHDLRHTFASRLVMAGVDLRQVQEFMGHKSIETTMRYAHLAPEHGKAAIEKLVAPARRAEELIASAVPAVAELRKAG